jgi:hypothetical protein
MLTQEELQNLLVLIETGARSISSQNPLDKAAEILILAKNLSTKLIEFNSNKET